MKSAFFLAVVTFVISTVFIAPYVKNKENGLKFTELTHKNTEIQEKLDDRAPSLSGSIDQDMIASEPGTSNSLIFLQVSVGNSGGSASIAKYYRLNVLLTNNTLSEAKPIDIIDEYRWSVLRTNTIMAFGLKRSELISEKTIKAIQPGESPRGWLLYRLPDTDLASMSETNFSLILSFLDVAGREIFVTNGLRQGKLSEYESLEFPRTLAGSENLVITNCPLPSDALVGPWQPPELPAGCSNVTVFFGTQEFTYPIVAAEASPEGKQFPLADLPDMLLKEAGKMPKFSPRMKYIWLRSAGIIQNIGGKAIDYPIVPSVVSNRFYVEVEIPFLNQKRKIVMSDELDSALPIPSAWDRNYSTNRNYYIYEIVNEHTNPVLQVAYSAPNVIHVNGIFVVDTNQILASFGGSPGLFTFGLGVSTETNKVTNSFSANQFFAEKLPLTTNDSLNDIYGIISNAFYHPTFPGQRAIFKYPSYRNLGVFDIGPGNEPPKK